MGRALDVAMGRPKLVGLQARPEAVLRREMFRWLRRWKDSATMSRWAGPRGSIFRMRRSRLMFGEVERELQA